MSTNQLHKKKVDAKHESLFMFFAFGGLMDEQKSIRIMILTSGLFEHYHQSKISCKNITRYGNRDNIFYEREYLK